MKIYMPSIKLLVMASAQHKNYIKRIEYPRNDREQQNAYHIKWWLK